MKTTHSRHIQRLLIAAVLTAGGFCAHAEQTDNYLFYAKEGVTIGYHNIEGNIIVNQGPLQMPQWAETFKSGTLYLNEGAYLANPLNYYTVGNGRVVTNAGLTVPYTELPVIPFANNFATVIPSVTLGWQYQANPYLIDSDTHIQQLTASSSTRMEVQAAPGTVVKVRIDTFSFQEFTINVTGGGSAWFFITDITSGSRGITINGGGSSDQAVVYFGESTEPATIVNGAVSGVIYSPSARAVKLTGSRILGIYDGEELQYTGTLYARGNVTLETHGIFLGGICAPESPVSFAGGGLDFRGRVFARTINVTALGSGKFADVAGFGTGGLFPENPELDLPAEYEWYTNALDQIVITKYLGTNTSVSVPDEINGLPVCAIDSGAFAGGNISAAVTDVHLPSGLLSIGTGVFSNLTTLTAVTFAEPVELESIGDYAFYGSTGLQNFAIPDGVQSIGQSAFENSGLSGRLTLPASVTEIGADAFLNNNDITYVLFRGNAPAGIGEVMDSCKTIYYLPGASGWDDFVDTQRHPEAMTVLLTAKIIPDSLGGAGDGTFYFDVTGSDVTTSPSGRPGLMACDDEFPDFRAVVSYKETLNDTEWTLLQTVDVLYSFGYGEFDDPDAVAKPHRFYKVEYLELL
ncbi:MAG: leucine-rich repeat domain-containing protein [Kiritimatiellales bacterium]